MALSDFDKLVADLWASFVRGVGDFSIQTGVYERAWERFENTCRANFDNGVFDQPGKMEEAIDCCRACGSVARALAQWGARRIVRVEDFDPAATLISDLSHAGAVC